MFNRLSSLVRSYLPTATTTHAAGRASAPPRSETAPSGRHPVLIALEADPAEGSPWRQCVFGVFGDLPDDVLRQIAHYVADDEVVAWSRICRQAFAVLRPEQLWRQLPAAVSRVVSLAMLRGAVRDIEQWAMPRASHWLATLALRLPLLEHGCVQQGFAILLDAAQRLPPARRGAVLETLAVARSRCAVPQAPCPIGLPLEERLLQAACWLAQDGVVRPFCTVVSHCSFDLAHGRCPAGWDATIRGLPESCRAPALVAVQARLNHTWHAGTDEKAWTDRVTLASELPPEDRDLGLVALALPNAHLGPAQAQYRFELMLSLVPSLPPQQRSGLYAALACLSMVVPQRHVRAAWSRLMDGVAALGPTDAANVVPYLYGALACMPPSDRHDCVQVIEQYLRSAAPPVSGVAADITRGPHTKEHWRLALEVRDTHYWITLPEELGSTVVDFLRTQRATVPVAFLTRERAPRMPVTWHARALEYRAAHLQNVHTPPGFSLDSETTQWNQLLERIQALPEEVQRTPLTALGDAAARSVGLLTARIVTMGLGLPHPGRDPVEDAWDRLANAAQRLPISHQIDMATRLAPELSSESALVWAFDVARVAPVARKAELLLGLLRNSEQCGTALRRRIWSTVLEQSKSLPRLPRTRVLRALEHAFPPETSAVWSRRAARQRLTDELAALGPSAVREAGS